MNIFSFSPFGYEGSLVAVEVDLKRGIPAVDIVGLADGAVKEARERMRSAICNSGFDFPMERVLISLSPADLKKEGAGFDLALALAVLSAESKDNNLGEKFNFGDEPVLVMGELELSGAVRPVKAVNAAASSAAAAGIRKCIVCSANAAEAREVKGMKVFGASNLAEAYEALSRPELFTGINEKENAAFVPEGCVDVEGVLFPPLNGEMDFEAVKGQKKLVRALQIAAAGGHNLLVFGPPGCGKSLALQKLPSILPILTVEEAQSVTRIHSLAGLLKPSEPLMRIPAFRIPHQTASIEGICGGGMNCRPGEISLAHNGTLFLDEAAEFRTSVLQMLRVPMESGSVTICRAGRSTIYPAQFQLLLASNPCPCGNYGSTTKICMCSAKAVDAYWRKFSGPLLDRIEIRVQVENEGNENSQLPPVSSSELRPAVAKAIKIQRNRQGKKNSRLTPQEILQFCKLGKTEQAILDKAVEDNNFSQRAVSGILKLSRTIADMEEAEKIQERHLIEAISLRINDGPLETFGGIPD